MKKILIFCMILGCYLSNLAFASTYTKINERTVVQIQTNYGDIIIRLFPDEAPLTCENFLSYVNSGFYNNTLFHRIIDGFLIQGGGFTTNYIAKPSQKPIKNESRGGLSNTTYTVSMALTTDRNSAASQFFINLANNTDLDYTTSKKLGYTVFAEVIDGKDVIDKIKKLRTRRLIVYSELYKRDVPLYDVPEQEVIIKNVSILR